MPVTLTITADTLAEALAQFGQPIGYVAPPAAPAYRETPEVELTFGPIADSRQAGLPVAAEAPKRGRPKATPAQEAARFKPAEGAEPKPPKPEPEPEPTGPVYAVRRYGGAIEGEYADSGTAADVLIGLMREAGDPEALLSLAKANAATAWPDDRGQDIQEAYEAALSALEPAPAAAGTAPQHFALDGSALLALTADKRGAMNGVNAVVAAEGGAGGGGYAAAKSYMESLGVARVSVLGDADPKLAEIAAWCAARLGLSVVLAV